MTGITWVGAVAGPRNTLSYTMGSSSSCAVLTRRYRLHLCILKNANSFYNLNWFAYIHGIESMESACCVTCVYNVAVGKQNFATWTPSDIEVNIVQLVELYIRRYPAKCSFSKVLNSYPRPNLMCALCARLWKLKLAGVAECEMEYFMEISVGDILNTGGVVMVLCASFPCQW